MIVFEDKKLVILTPPHTASGNTHRALCSVPLGGVWAIGQTPDRFGFDHHVMQVAEGWSDFTVAVVVRHPLDRLIGLYEHHQHAASKRTDWPLLPWWLFVAMVLANHPDLSWFYRMTIGELLGNQKIDRVIRYESLGSDLSDLLGEPVELLPGNDNARDLSAYYAQIGPCCQAEWWGRDDMERFGYKSVF